MSHNKQATALRGLLALAKKAEKTPPQPHKMPESETVLVEVPGWKDNTVIRITTEHFRDRRYFHIRLWYTQDGQLRPGKAGINLPYDKLPVLLNAILQGVTMLESAGAHVEAEKR